MIRERIDYKGLPVATLDYPLNVFRYVFGTDAPFISYPTCFLEERISFVLSPSQGKVLTAFFLDGLSLKEASTTLDLRENAIRVCLREALSRINFRFRSLMNCSVITPKEFFQDQVYNAGFSSRLEGLLIRMDHYDGFWNYEKTLDENLLSKSPEVLLNCPFPYRSPGFGEKTIAELRDYLHSKGYEWGKEFFLAKVEKAKTKLEKKEMQLKKAQLDLERLKQQIKKMQTDVGVNQ